MTGRSTGPALVAALLAAAAAGHGAAPAAGAQVPSLTLFEWSVPSSYGEQRRANGMIEETDPADVPTGPWRVRLQVLPAFCREDSRYRWSVNGEPLATTRAPGCLFQAQFAEEGVTYPVRLEVELDGRTLDSEQRIAVQDWFIVSLGDSVASGEAVPDVPGFARSLWQSVPCHRSARAGPAKAARRIEQLDPHTSVTFVHLGCSGATIEQGLLGAYDGVLREAFSQPQPAQVRVLNRLAGRRKPDAVLLSVGANDVYFGEIVRHCATHRSPDCFEDTLPVAGQRTIAESVADALETLEANYDLLDDEIDARVERPRVHIVDYFDPTRGAMGNTCERSLGFVDASELDSARSRVLEPLNDALVDAADRHDWTAVTGMAELFAKHGYCAGRQAWVTTLSGSAARSGGPVKGRFLGTLHPNEAGQEVIAAAIVASLQRSLYPGQVFEPPVGEAGPPPGPTDDGDGLSTLTIVLIVVGGLVVLGLVAALGWAAGRRQGESG